MFTGSVVSLILLAGCSDRIQGRWRLHEMQPTLGFKDFTITQASFYPNGSFETVALRGEEMTRTKGTYDFSCLRGELTLTTGDRILTYDADIRDEGKQLRVTATGPDGVPTTAVMVRHFKYPYYSQTERHPPCECTH